MGMNDNTCIISGLPILPKEPARMVFLQMVDPLYWANARGGPVTMCEFWKPLSLPLLGTAHHYAGIEGIAHDWNLQLTLGRFHLDLIEQPPSQFEGDATRQALGLTGPMSDNPDETLKHLMDLLHRNRLVVRDHPIMDDPPKEGRVSVCFIREDVYQHLAALDTDSHDYTGRTRAATTAWALKEVGLPTVPPRDGPPSIEAYLTDLATPAAARLARMAKIPGLDLDIDAMAESMDFMQSHRLSRGPAALAIDYAKHRNSHGAGLDATVAEIVLEVSNYLQVVHHMSHLRRFWAPQMATQEKGLGSQHALATKVHEITTRLLAERPEREDDE